jgi:hypothetical protein
MKMIKHIGKMKNTGAKVVVIFRTLPGESNSALVLPTATLPDAYHNALMELIETDSAQQSFELGEIMFVRHFPDGRPMLQAMQVDNRIQKVSTDTVVMTPSINNEIPLDQLNVLIAEQKNCAVDDLCTFVKGSKPERKNNSAEKETPTATVTQAPENAVLTDVDLAKSYRSQADSLYKEAARLRKEADELDPPQKKASKTKETTSA